MKPYLFDPTQEHLLSLNRSPIWHTGKKSGCLTRLKQVFTALAMMVMIPIAVIGIFINFANPLQVAVNGAVTTGQYVSRQNAQKGLPWVTYRYEIDGIAYEATTRVSVELFQRAPDLPSLTLYYARHNPQISFLEPVNWLSIGFFGLLVLVVIYCIFMGIKDLRKLLHDYVYAQRMLPGVLLEVSPIKTPNGVLWQIYYEFKPPMGQVIQGKYTSARRILSDRAVPPPGSPIVVVYTDPQTHYPL